MGDLDLALKFADALASLEEPGMPAWTRQMPAFILNAKGNKGEALEVMTRLLGANAGRIHPNEANFTREYICTRILNPAEAKTFPLCQNNKY